LDVTIAAINTTKDLVPIALAQGILGTIANILTIAQSVIKNKSDFKAIADKCETIKEILERSNQCCHRQNLMALSRSVNYINSDVESKKEQRFLRRLFAVTIDRDKIAAWEKDLDRVLGLFNVRYLPLVAFKNSHLSKLNSHLRSFSLNKLLLTKPISFIEPPPRPAMLFGRDVLVAELTNLVVNDKHLALIGTGGMGKSSLAKAIINEPLVRDKFADRRFFVTYDGLKPSTITLEIFMAHFAGALGIEISNADPLCQISTFLRSARTLIVLDNAETFEEASASLALRDIPPAIAEIASIPGVILVLTSHSRRNAPNVEWITKDVPSLDLSSAQARWTDLRSKVLDGGKGKLQSLSNTMQLSLSSPSIQNLGEDGLRALAIIAFLPQGLNRDLASDLLPSLPQVDTICDVLCIQSLVYRQDNFLKMLAPIRHYVQDSLQAHDSRCLQDIRAFYYRTIESCSEERNKYANTITSDHLNIEQVVAFNLADIPDDAEETYNACWLFSERLRWHLPRPTTLTPAIFSIPDNSSMWTLKVNCLLTLAWLYNTLSQLAEASQAFQAAEALCLTAGDPKRMADCLITRADSLRAQGRFMLSEKLLENLQHSRSWESLSEAMKA
ncbi:hypothetical protein DFJ58DRAFT_659543, partial [Suillus subalutaceus]|uniref:uncharacterized protein n=1 Tax=Suillus subalutaceus TaxID=48586 RepID=UPI001B87EDA0